MLKAEYRPNAPAATEPVALDAPDVARQLARILARLVVNDPVSVEHVAAVIERLSLAKLRRA